MGDCVFCKIVRGEIPATKEYEDDDVVAIRDISPKAPIHILIIPKKHVKNLSGLTDKDSELIAKLNLTATNLAKKLGIGEKFKLTTNVGKEAGQIVMHLHYHLLGGWNSKDDVQSELHI